METYKPKPLEERKSQKLNFWDFTRERLFWSVLPLVTAGAAMLFGKLTKFKMFPLDGSPDLLSTVYAKAIKFSTKKNAVEAGEQAAQWLKDGGWAGGLIKAIGGENAQEKQALARKYYFNFVKGAEVATPFSVYFLWKKSEGNRLDLEDAGNKLKHLEALKPTDSELAQQNAVMRKELEFAARTGGGIPPATIDKTGAEYHGRLVERQKERM